MHALGVAVPHSIHGRANIHTLIHNELCNLGIEFCTTLDRPGTVFDAVETSDNGPTNALDSLGMGGNSNSSCMSLRIAVSSIRLWLCGSCVPSLLSPPALRCCSEAQQGVFLQS